MNKEEKFNKVLDGFLKEEKVDFGDLDEEMVDLFEVSLILKKRGTMSEFRKEKTYNSILLKFRETKNGDNYNLFSLFSQIFGILFDISPINNNEHLSFSDLYKANDTAFFKIKFFSYLQSRQFLYNYIGGNIWCIGFETLR